MEDDDDEESWSSDSWRNVLGHLVSGISFSMEIADQIVVVIVVVLRVRLWVSVLEKLKESLLVGFVLGEVEMRGKRVKRSWRVRKRKKR